MKTNEQLQTDIENALKWEPTLHAAEVGVIVKDGVVTLTGTVDSYSKKLEAEAAVKNVTGVKALVETIQVEFGAWGKKSDSDLANAVLTGLKNNWSVPAEKLNVRVEEGGITLTGEVPWQYQKDAAALAVRNLDGVRLVLNEIVVRPDSKDRVEQHTLENALARNSSFLESNILVRVQDNNVTLNGTVGSWFGLEEAERTAWKTPGIRSVKNELVIDYGDN